MTKESLPKGIELVDEVEMSEEELKRGIRRLSTALPPEKQKIVEEILEQNRQE